MKRKMIATDERPNAKVHSMRMAGALAATVALVGACALKGLGQASLMLAVKPAAKPDSKIQVQKSYAGNYDLGSGVRQFRSPSAATVMVGSKVLNVKKNMILTAAEIAAVVQVNNGQRQSLSLAANGTANGGTIEPASDLSESIGDLTIPPGVTVVHDLSKFGVLKLDGSLINRGRLCLENAAATDSQAIVANSIVNGELALISIKSASIAPVLQRRLDLPPICLSARKIIGNAGIIESDREIKLAAGDKLINDFGLERRTQVKGEAYGNEGIDGSTDRYDTYAEHARSRPRPLLLAQGNVTLESRGPIINRGLINSEKGDIRILANDDALVDNNGGTVRSENGSIVITSPETTPGTTIRMLGGDWLSKNLFIDNESGEVKARVGRVTGLVHSRARVEHFIAESDKLLLASNYVAEDPVFANNMGSISISGVNDFGAQPVYILAAKDIIAEKQTIISAHGKSIILIAGATLNTSGNEHSQAAGASQIVSAKGRGLTGKSVKVTFSPGNHGDINLSSATGQPVVKTSGGNVVLLAYADQGKGGHVILPQSDSAWSIDSSSTSGHGGNVTITAGASEAKAVSVQAGNIRTSSAVRSGFVHLTAAQPTISDGTFDENSIKAKFAASPLTEGGITAGLIMTGGGGGAGEGAEGASASEISILAGGDISAQSLEAFGGGGGGGLGGFTKTTAGTGGNGGNGAKITVKSASGKVIVKGDLNSSGGGGGGGGGGCGEIMNNPGATGGQGGVAGPIVVIAKKGSTPVVSGKQMAADGGAGGSGGRANIANGGGSAAGGGGGSSFGGGGGGGAGGAARSDTGFGSGSGGGGGFGTIASAGGGGAGGIGSGRRPLGGFGGGANLGSGVELGSGGKGGEGGAGVAARSEGGSGQPGDVSGKPGGTGGTSAPGGFAYQPGAGAKDTASGGANGRDACAGSATPGEGVHEAAHGEESVAVSSQIPNAWQLDKESSKDYAVMLDETEKHGGERSAFIKSNQPRPSGSVILCQALAADQYKDQHLRLSAWVKTKLEGGTAQLFCRVDGDWTASKWHPAGTFDNMCDRPIQGDSDWTRYDIVVQVPKNAQEIWFGLTMTGRGEAWLDDVSLDPVGQDVAITGEDALRLSPRPANLQFEDTD